MQARALRVLSEPSQRGLDSKPEPSEPKPEPEPAPSARRLWWRSTPDTLSLRSSSSCRGMKSKRSAPADRGFMYTLQAACPSGRVRATSRLSSMLCAHVHGFALAPQGDVNVDKTVRLTDQARKHPALPDSQPNASQPAPSVFLSSSGAPWSSERLAAAHSLVR